VRAVWRRLRYVLGLIALCAIATCPAAKRSCTAHRRAAEADDLLDAIADRVAAIVATTGHVPPVAAGPTPQPSCCDQGGTCSADAKTWDSPGWRALEFSIDGSYRYTYQYTPDPSGSGALVTAIGDLDCDGHRGRYELRLTVDGTKLERSWTRTDPYE
jgi:hypothetical protein